MPDLTALPDHVPGDEQFLLRHDAIHGWPIFYAPARATRPFEIAESRPFVCGPNDPFAEGREAGTTPESYAIRDPDSKPDGPGWQVRIIPNKFPAVAPLGFAGPSQSTESSDSLIPAGVHEVIVECPDAQTHFTRLAPTQQALVFQAMQARMRQLSREPELKHAMIFKNHGAAAGASLTHSHSQLLATAFVPMQLQREIDHCGKLFTEQGQDYFKTLIDKELRDGRRIVAHTDDFVVLCPAASRFGFEMHILPTAHGIHFHQAPESIVNQLSRVIADCLSRLERIARDPAYNMVLHTAPFGETELPGFRWHWEIYPRIAGIAGFELGAGSFVNALLPETAAQLLKSETANPAR